MNQSIEERLENIEIILEKIEAHLFNALSLNPSYQSLIKSENIE